MSDKRKPSTPYRRIIVTQVGQENYEVKKLINFMDLHRGQVITKQDLQTYMDDGITIIVE